MAGSDVAVRHFPFLIGRAAESHLRLEDPGVWDKHLQIQFQNEAGFTFATQSQALTLINAEPQQHGTLKNGDLIELGSTRMRFWLARGEQKARRGAEVLTWMALLGLFLAQAALIVCMLR